MNEKKKITGLTDAEVLESRRLHGANVLTRPTPEPLWRRFLLKFTDPLIVILLVAGVLSACISCYEWAVLEEGTKAFLEPVGIFIAIFLATGLSFIFEVKADREFNLLNSVSDEEPVNVIRNGKPCRVPRRDVVVGDIVKLTTGDEVAADGVLLKATELSIDESTLTGEPICQKTADEAHLDADATFPSNHALRGTKVMEGHGVMRVEAVGDQTENGRVFTASQIDDSVRTPLNEQLDRLSRYITWASYGVAALIVEGRLFVFFHTQEFSWIPFLAYFLQSVMIAVTLIVVAVPEGLPMAVTLSLAYSMRRMLKTNNLVRRMHACETMGAATVICTDKTGTLTQNQMRVSQMNFFCPPWLSDEGFRQLMAEGIAVNSTAELGVEKDGRADVLGNPTEGALLLWLREKGFDYNELRQDVIIEAELPFSTERKLMATVIKQRESGQRIIYIKGAPEYVAAYCNDADRETLKKLLDDYQAQAMRTLAFAFKLLAAGEPGIGKDCIAAKGLHFAALTAISDPIRDDVPAAVKECLQAGIDVKIVTGDTPGTAREIGRQAGLWTPADGEQSIVTGQELAAMSDDELQKRAPLLKIIARARPMDKKRLVEALQRGGSVVAVTGDGTNDAPALKAAHVGLSMGDGTHVAKEASDITIIDNSFASIGRAVLWGRSLYRNIQRFILFQTTVNVVACLIVLCGAFMGTESPLTVTQMLWVNLIMDTFAAMALASLPPDRRVMAEPPRRRKAFIISRVMMRKILGKGLLFFIVLMAFLIVLERYDVQSLTTMPATCAAGSASHLTLYEQSLFFTTFVMLQFWNLFCVQSLHSTRSVFSLRGCRGFLIIAFTIFIGQVLIVSLGGPAFNVAPLSLTDWLVIIVATSLVILI